MLYYTYDGNFNVAGLVDMAGTVRERYAYDAYGAPRVLDADGSSDADNASDFANEILFCGYCRDAESGLYCVRNRYYHPRLGRWISRDPAGYRGGPDLYEYVGNRPGTFTDPTGEQQVFIPPMVPPPYPPDPTAPIWPPPPFPTPVPGRACPAKPPGKDTKGDGWCNDSKDNPFHQGQDCWRSYDDGTIGGTHCCYRNDELVDQHWDTVAPNKKKKNEGEDSSGDCNWGKCRFAGHVLVDVIPSIIVGFGGY